MYLPRNLLFNLLMVYLGVWTNWSKGSVFGSTITMTQYNGNLLIAFIALFVSFVGTSLWRITGFVLHRLFSTTTAQDGIYHQRQAILRNAANATDAVWDIASVLWNSRRAARSYRRLVPSLASATFSLLAFAIAGIFSSKMATLTGSEVLLASPSCGMPLGSPGSTTDQLLIIQPWIAQRMTSAMNYAQRCYFKNSRIEDCNLFVKPQLASTINWNASCPFQEDICLKSNENIELDTGLIGSHYDLGFNGPNSKRMQLRRVISCAPLKTENYTDSFVYQSSTGNVSYQRYAYGPRFNKNGFNYTHMQPEISQDLLNMSSFKTTFGDFELSYLQTYSFKGSLIPQVSEFRPIEAIHRGDADVSLIFLSTANIVFTKPVDDPWYSAHRPLKNVTAVGRSKGKQELYMADSPASVLGCAIQYQQCMPSLPDGRRCSELCGLWETNQTISTEDEWQFNMTQWIGTAFAESEVQYLVSSLRAGSLTSKYSNIASLQGPLPSNQWQLDVEQWHYATLAAAQASAVDYAIGPGANKSIR
ncbi:hypothetical protein K505DRAFT_344820 [Melanomma pulvis-pyrius CBS 109.77]|uniref:Uncharacterized protein n=1 Tax=Melanomma pulvis-pyrius CBS 109.77 TaxID=1314802 RepID=A0A6A6XYZ6_9PLEO|nr:hypothetical protein K505DRAFT_344820 [Melanomma pulvis-pyrius CBS 109.77]